MNRIAATAFAVILTIAPIARAAPQAGIAELLEAYRAAWARRDEAALGRFYPAEGELSTPYGVTLQGPDQIAAFYRQAFARGYAGSVGAAQLGEVRFASPRIALLRGRWGISGARDEKGGERPPECGPFFAVVRREAGQWRILALHELGGACDGAAMQR